MAMTKPELLAELMKQSEMLDSMISFLQTEPETKQTETDVPDYCMTLEQSKIEVLSEPLKLYKVVRRLSFPKVEEPVCTKCLGTGFVSVPNTLVNQRVWCDCRKPSLIYDIMEFEVGIAIPDLPNNMKIYVVGNEWIPSTSIYDKYVPELYKQYENVYYTSKEQAEIHKEELGSA